MASLKIQKISLHPYEIPLTNGITRKGVILEILDEKGRIGWGDVAPLPNWSHETLEMAMQQLHQKHEDIVSIKWTSDNLHEEMKKLNLFPSVLFGVESALLSLLSPLPEYSIATSALLMGSPSQIFEQAKLRLDEGYTFAKLKVSNLSFKEASQVILELKEIFRLRIDVNRAWDTEDSMRFFAQFPLDAFDYVEEPFKNPADLGKFTHRLAVDESFQALSLKMLETLSTLKAVIYKPTIQGGLLGCLHLHKWAKEREIDVVLSSSFESDVGLTCVASIAQRLSLSAPVGLGTYHYLTHHFYGYTSLCPFNVITKVPNMTHQQKLHTSYKADVVQAL